MSRLLPIVTGAAAVSIVVASAGGLARSGGRGGAVGSAAPSTQARDTATARLSIAGMTCGTCATTARIALQRVRGVYRATVSYDSASAVVRYDPALTRPEVFVAELQRLTAIGQRWSRACRQSGARLPPGPPPPRPPPRSLG